MGTRVQKPKGTPGLECRTPQVQKALIDMENMFELLATTPAIRDEPGAAPLRVTAGRVEFRSVVFGYGPARPVLRVGLGCGERLFKIDGLSILAVPTAAFGLQSGSGRCAVFMCRPRTAPLPRKQGVSFVVPGSTTLAVVGSTGSGKSTILRSGRPAEPPRMPLQTPSVRACLGKARGAAPTHTHLQELRNRYPPIPRLLLRFYDPQSGSVLIDGANIRRATQASVRSAIAVVPQVQGVACRVLLGTLLVLGLPAGRVDPGTPIRVQGLPSRGWEGGCSGAGGHRGRTCTRG